MWATIKTNVENADFIIVVTGSCGWKMTMPPISLDDRMMIHVRDSASSCSMNMFNAKIEITFNYSSSYWNTERT